MMRLLDAALAGMGTAHLVGLIVWRTTLRSRIRSARTLTRVLAPTNTIVWLTIAAYLAQPAQPTVVGAAAAATAAWCAAWLRYIPRADT